MIKIHHKSEIVQFFQQTTDIRDYISPSAADLNRESSTPCCIKTFEDFKIYRGSRFKNFGEGSYFMALAITCWQLTAYCSLFLLLVANDKYPCAPRS